MSAPAPTHGLATRAVHAGGAPDAATGARVTPIYASTAFVFDDVEHAAALFNLQTYGYIYSRLTNPTVAALEERLAALEGGKGATCASSGHAAQLLAFLPLMRPGARFVASKRLYGGSVTQFGVTFKRFGWEADFVDLDDLDALRAAIGPDTKAVFLEALANPGGVVFDLEAIAAVAAAAGVPTIVDNTLASPALLRPFEWGASLVVHSTTKFISGHGSALGGVVIDSGRFDWSAGGRFPSLSEPDPAYHGLKFYETFGDLAYTVHGHAVGLRDLGCTMSPHNAFQTLQGVETLTLRMRRQSETALAVSAWLERHPAIAWVSYAGLASSPHKARADKYLPHGAGAVFTIGLKGGYAAGVRLVEAVDLFSHLANVGDTRSLIIHPASTTHRQLTDAQRIAAGAGPDVVRLSIGLEDAEDLIRDLDAALARAVQDPA